MQSHWDIEIWYTLFSSVKFFKQTLAEVKRHLSDTSFVKAEITNHRYIT